MKHAHYHKDEDSLVYVVISDYYLVGVYRKRSDAIRAIQESLGGLTRDAVEEQLSSGQGYCIGYDTIFGEKTCMWLQEMFVR